MKLTETLFLNADKSKAVRLGDRSAAFLLGVAGQEIPDKLAIKLGLLPSQDKLVEAAMVQTRDPEIQTQSEPVIQKRRGRPPKV